MRSVTEYGFPLLFHWLSKQPSAIKKILISKLEALLNSALLFILGKTKLIARPVMLIMTRIQTTEQRLEELSSAFQFQLQYMHPSNPWLLLLKKSTESLLPYYVCQNSSVINISQQHTWYSEWQKAGIGTSKLSFKNFCRKKYDESLHCLILEKNMVLAKALIMKSCNRTDDKFKNTNSNSMDSCLYLPFGSAVYAINWRLNLLYHNCKCPMPGCSENLTRGHWFRGNCLLVDALCLSIGIIKFKGVDTLPNAPMYANMNDRMNALYDMDELMVYYFKLLGVSTQSTPATNLESKSCYTIVDHILNFGSPELIMETINCLKLTFD